MRKTSCIPVKFDEKKALARLAYPCRHCPARFAQQSSRSRHETHRCPDRPGQPEATQITPAEKVIKLEAEIESLKAAMQSGGIAIPTPPVVISSNTNGVAGTPPVASNIVGNHSGNSYNHNHSHNTDDHSQNVHITINSWGHEDMTGMKQKLASLFDECTPGTDGKTILAKVLRAIYGDPEKPENMTAILPNKRDLIPMIMTESGWELRSEAEVYPEMVKRSCTTINDAQDVDLLTHEDGIACLKRREQHMRAAWEEEKTMNSREVRSLLVPLLLGNRHHLEALKAAKLTLAEIQGDDEAGADLRCDPRP